MNGDGEDDATRSTNTDASVSRLAAVNKGYWSDPHAHLFCKRSSSPAPTRPPLINRGTFLRNSALNALMHAFATSFPLQTCQVVSLGAGSDTRAFLGETDNQKGTNDRAWGNGMALWLIIRQFHDGSSGSWYVSSGWCYIGLKLKYRCAFHKSLLFTSLMLFTLGASSIFTRPCLFSLSGLSILRQHFLFKR